MRPDTRASRTWSSRPTPACGGCSRSRRRTMRFGDHTVQAYVSSGPDLATATWTAGRVESDFARTPAARPTPCSPAAGRSALRCRTIGSTDYAHVFVSAAFDGQISSNGHSRAQLGATSITLGSRGTTLAHPILHPSGRGRSGNPAAPPATHTSWGNSVGISTGGFIHHFSVTMDQEVDCAVGRSTNADIAATWTNGFGTNVSPAGSNGTSPPKTTAVIDKTMTNECKALAFAPLASDVMLAVYSNGAGAAAAADQPALSEVGRGRTPARGRTSRRLPAAATATSSRPTRAINQNDWALVPVNTEPIYVFRRKPPARPSRAASTTPAPTRWITCRSAAPPAFSAGQAFKSGGGLFGATDGTERLAVLSSTPTPPTRSSSRNSTASPGRRGRPCPARTPARRRAISLPGYRRPASDQIGLAWTAGHVARSTSSRRPLNTGRGGGASPVTATMTAPLNGSIGLGHDHASAPPRRRPPARSPACSSCSTASNLGAEDTSAPTRSPGTRRPRRAARTSCRPSRATARRTRIASSTVTVSQRHHRADGVDDRSRRRAGLGLERRGCGERLRRHRRRRRPVPARRRRRSAPKSRRCRTRSTGTRLPRRRRAHAGRAGARCGGTADDVRCRSTSRSPANRVTPTITWATPAAIAYGTPLGAAQFNATASVPGHVRLFAARRARCCRSAPASRCRSTFTPTDTATYTTAAANVVDHRDAGGAGHHLADAGGHRLRDGARARRS